MPIESRYWFRFPLFFPIFLFKIAHITGLILCVFQGSNELAHSWYFIAMSKISYFCCKRQCVDAFMFANLLSSPSENYFSDVKLHKRHLIFDIDTYLCKKEIHSFLLKMISCTKKAFSHFNRHVTFFTGSVDLYRLILSVFMNCF